MQIPELEGSVKQEAPGVSEQAIRERAYELYEIRGCQEGHADEDWFMAEAELVSRSDLNKAA